MFLQTREWGIIFLKTIFWLDCTDVFRSPDFRSDIKPRGYQADDLRMSLTSIRFSHIPFSYVFWMRIKFSVIHVYAHTCICPDKAAQMYFDRISLEHVLGMINFPQIVQTMIIQIICADLSASSRLYVFRNDAV